MSRWNDLTVEEQIAIEADHPCASCVKFRDDAYSIKKRCQWGGSSNPGVDCVGYLKRHSK